MKTILSIHGMHCASCVALLTRELRQIPGVHSATVSLHAGTAVVQHGPRVTRGQLASAVTAAGYSLDAPTEKKRQDPWQLASALLFVALLSYLFLKADLARSVPDISEGASFGIALLVGVVASFSTCLALLGGLVLALSAQSAGGSPRTQLLFQAGRIGGFFLLGGILGTLGGSLAYSPALVGVMTLVVAVIMASLGLQLLGIIPSLSRFGIALPASLALRIERILRTKHPAMPVVLGATTFFLPCGFTQSMQLAAVASGSFLSGAFIMTAFALGTLPTLLLLGLGGKKLQSLPIPFFRYVIAGVILAFALYSVNSSLVLLGSRVTLSFPSVTASAPVAADSSQTGVTQGDGVQVVRMNVTPLFEPESFTIKKDIPVRFEIYGQRISGCVNGITLPSLGIRERLRQGKTTTLEFTPTTLGPLPFSCLMGMVRGTFTVIP